MVGQGVWRELLRDDDVTEVLSIARSSSGEEHPKLRELLLRDMYDYRDYEVQLRGYDACLFCLGVSSAGMNEADYHRVTYELTLAAAETLARVNPKMTFAYVSGAGTDSTEKGRSMWARVKGKTENALRALPFAATYMFRPAYIQPLHGIKSKTALYRIPYAIGSWTFPLLEKLFPRYVTTTEELGRAMIGTAKRREPSAILESVDIRSAAKR